MHQYPDTITETWDSLKYWNLNTEISLRAIGSTIVTVPSVWYLIQPQLHKKEKGHGHGHHEGEEEHEHDDEHDGADEDMASEESEPKGQDEEKDVGQDDNEDQGADQSEEAKSDTSDSEDGGQDTPDTSSDEGSENGVYEREGGSGVEGVKFKGSTSGGTRDGEQGDTRKHIPDAKGFSKNRIESHYGNKQGEAQNEEQDASKGDMVSQKDRNVNSSSLTFSLRPPPPNQQATRPRHSPASRRVSRTPTPNTRPILLTIQIRVRKAKEHRKPQSRKALSIQDGHRSETLDNAPVKRCIDLLMYRTT